MILPFPDIPCHARIQLFWNISFSVRTEFLGKYYSSIGNTLCLCVCACGVQTWKNILPAYQCWQKIFEALQETFSNGSLCFAMLLAENRRYKISFDKYLYFLINKNAWHSIEAVSHLTDWLLNGCLTN